MDISFYALLTLACLVLVLAMWACASSNTAKWGPDLTMELPPHLLREALFRTPSTTTSKNKEMTWETAPSAPSDLPCDPLLSNEQAAAQSSPPTGYFRPVLMNTAVRVLPTNYVQQQKVRPVFCTFSTGEPA